MRVVTRDGATSASLRPPTVRAGLAAPATMIRTGLAARVTVERETGFEPATPSLEGWRSTAELFPPFTCADTATTAAAPRTSGPARRTARTATAAHVPTRPRGSAAARAHPHLAQATHVPTRPRGSATARAHPHLAQATHVPTRPRGSATARPTRTSPRPPTSRPGLAAPLQWWGGEDLNPRRRTPADLQSAPFGHLGTSPNVPARDENSSAKRSQHWRWREDLNPRPTAYKAVALPLSYASTGKVPI